MSVQCPYCNMWFRRAKGRNIHIARVHGRRKFASFKSKLKKKKRRR